MLWDSWGSFLHPYGIVPWSQHFAGWGTDFRNETECIEAEEKSVYIIAVKTKNRSKWDVAFEILDNQKRI